jgi:hypothetical protein
VGTGRGRRVHAAAPAPNPAARTRDDERDVHAAHHAADGGRAGERGLDLERDVVAAVGKEHRGDGREYVKNLLHRRALGLGREVHRLCRPVGHGEAGRDHAVADRHERAERADKAEGAEVGQLRQQDLGACGGAQGGGCGVLRVGQLQGKPQACASPHSSGRSAARGWQGGSTGAGGCHSSPVGPDPHRPLSAAPPNARYIIHGSTFAPGTQSLMMANRSSPPTTV